MRSVCYVEIKVWVLLGFSLPGTLCPNNSGTTVSSRNKGTLSSGHAYNET
jgi:hypothetical protein